MSYPPNSRPIHGPTSSSYIITTENKKPTCVERTFWILAIIVTICTFPFSLLVCLFILQEYQRAVVFRMGRLRPEGVIGPGIVFILPCIDTVQRVDLRTIAYDIPRQDVLTKDSVTIAMDAVVYYRVYNPLKCVIQVQDYRMATQLLAQTALRNIAGIKALEELMADKENTSLLILKILDGATEPWGVKCERVEIKDVHLPPSLQKALAAEAEAEREAQAKIIAAEGELMAARALKDASDEMSKNPVAFQLRYLQTLNTICDRQTRSVVFPLPIDIIQKLLPHECNSSSCDVHK